MLKLLTAIASEKRLEILEALSKRDRTLLDLQELLKLSDASVVRHVGILEDSDLVTRTKKLSGHIIKLNKTTLNKISSYLRSLE